MELLITVLNRSVRMSDECLVYFLFLFVPNEQRQVSSVRRFGFATGWISLAVSHSRTPCEEILLQWAV